MNENSHLKILVVDDVPENLQIVASTLAPLGYQLRFADTGQSALDAAAAEPIDLVLLDIMMPGIGGFEVCRRLKSSDVTADVPVIFITAKADLDSVVEGFEAGGVDYVTKPFQVEELRARVSTHLRLRSREKELEQINDARIRFLSVLSHDLKIPIQGISDYLTAMREGFEQISIGELRENLNVVGKAADDFTNMIHNLLGYSSIQSGLAIFRPDELELAPLVQEMVNGFSAQEDGRQLKWEVVVPEGLSVLADLEMTQSILRNLLLNSIKYNKPDGLIRVSASADDVDVSISVEDEGCGISPENLASVFELSREVRGVGMRGELSSGMGLLLAKESVERHGGEIRIESELDKGTLVTFTLPRMS